MAIREIWSPATISVGHPCLFSSGEIEAYETDILSNDKSNEHDASRFFRRFPKFLYLGQAAEIRPEVVVSSYDSAKFQRVDFFRRRYASSFWDIVELKHPNKPYLSGDKTQHIRLSAEVDKAINQAQDYRDLIDSSGEIREKLLGKGIKVWKPQIMIVAGKHSDDIDPEILQALQDRVRQRGPIEAWSYNNIYQFAKEHYKNNKVICIPTVHFTTINVEIPEVDLDGIISRIISNKLNLDEIPWQTFEEIISRLYQREGYDVMQTPITRAGVDLVVSNSSIGEINCVVQCKHYSKSKIGISDIRELYLAVLTSYGITTGILVTSGDVSKQAREFAESKKYTIELIDRTALLNWMSRSLAKR